MHRTLSYPLNLLIHLVLFLHLAQCNYYIQHNGLLFIRIIRSDADDPSHRPFRIIRFEHLSADRRTEYPDRYGYRAFVPRGRTFDQEGNRRWKARLDPSYTLSFRSHRGCTLSRICFRMQGLCRLCRCYCYPQRGFILHLEQ